ncbi:MAG: extracellular solute-binding protein [Sphaerochaetaceae bacterium]|nr:extracellular solute-binding protein [Sphaerochaetaceae bacterium]
MKKMRVVVLLLILSVCLVPVFANGGKESVSGSKAKLVYWTMWNEAEPQGLVIGEAVAAFTKSTGVDVEVVFNGRDIRKTLQPALDAGETIDLFDEDIERVLNTWGNYLLPLDSYMTKVYPTTNGKPYRDVVNKTLVDLMYNLGGGSIKNMPYQPSAFVTMYNKDLFDKAGVTSLPKTWEEFLVVCEKLVKIGVTPITVDDAYMAAFFGYNMDRLVGMDETVRMVRENDFSGPQVLEFGKIWEEMAKKGYISKKAASNIYPSGQVEEIATGKVAMYLNGTWLPNEIKGNAPNMNWGAFAWPAISAKGDGIEANNYGAQSFGVNKNTKYPDEAFQLVVWLTTGEWDAKLAAESLGVPMGNDSQWPKQLAEAKVVIDNTTVRLPWAVGMEDNPDINAKIKENFAKLITGSINAEGFAAGMRK